MKESIIYKEAIKQWGIPTQVGMLMEEMAELIIAVNKYNRAPCEALLERMEEETADVRIMLGQLKEMFKLRDSNIGTYKQLKLRKLAVMLGLQSDEEKE